MDDSGSNFGDGTLNLPDATIFAVRQRASDIQAGEQIGPYRVLKRLGAGGMGEVWLAEETGSVHRHVALKVVKPGMDSVQIVARFDVERQALGMMVHPAIATVFGGGTTPRGRPYFAMEYVKGEPIVSYCDRHRLSLPERIDLVRLVCDGVQHAHQKGIIHRDLKPSNVLITIIGDRPMPKIIDFGVAKATTQPLTENALYTELGVLIGTPEYMSPEQAEGGALDIDTRTDVYSIGVMLYELLTGTLPFDRDALRRGGVDGVRRVIREVEPAKPSSRVTQLGPSLQQAAHNRRTEPARLSRTLRGDLDWIVIKALEKDRTRRYASASELSSDLGRFLRSEPVSAGPPTTTYRVRKFVGRHRGGVAVSTAAVLSLLAFGISMGIQARRVAVQRDLAAHERDKAQQIAAFLVSLFQASMPDRAKGEPITARQLLDRGQQRLAVELKDQPQTRAALLHSIGEAYDAIGQYDSAESALIEALAIRRSATGRERADLADTLNRLGGVYYSKGDLTRGEPLQREAWQIRREVLGAADIKVAQSLLNLGNYEYFRGRYDEANQLYREAVATELRAGGPPGEIALMRVNVANVLMRQDRLTDAIDLLKNALATLRQAYGDEHTRTQYVLNSLGFALFLADRPSEAEPLQREVLAVRRKLLGEGHFDVAIALYNLGNTLQAMGRFAESEEHFRNSVSIHSRAGKQPNMNWAWALADLGLALRYLGKLEESERAYRQSIDMFDHAPNVPPGESGWARDGLGDLFYERHQLAAAERILREALVVRQQAKAVPTATAATQELLARVLCEGDDIDEGERLAREAVESRRKAEPPTKWKTAFAESVLGRCMAKEGHFTEAEPLLTGAYGVLVQRAPAREETIYAATGLVDLYERQRMERQTAEWRATRARNQAGQP